jgi:hypothetical protein
MIVLFLASTLYHALQHNGAKRVFRVLDHGAHLPSYRGNLYALLFDKPGGNPGPALLRPGMGPGGGGNQPLRDGL